MDYLDNQIEGTKEEVKKGKKYKKKRTRNLMKERAALKKQASGKNKVSQSYTHRQLICQHP